MKKLLLILLCFASIAHAQDTITLHHQRYTTTFDKRLYYPVLVHWIVTSDDVCKPHASRRVERKDSYFVADPLLLQYTQLRSVYLNNPGHYERGHNMDAADNSCNLTQMKECHFFSNITPQTKELNEQVWGDLEDHTRHMVELYGKVEVWCGSFGNSGITIGQVTVPAYCWKIIKYNGIYEAYIMPNTHTANQEPYDNYQVTVAKVIASMPFHITGL